MTTITNSFVTALLAAGQSATVTINTDLVAAPLMQVAGSYQAWAVVDNNAGASDLVESDETNNASSLAF